MSDLLLECWIIMTHKKNIVDHKWQRRWTIQMVDRTDEIIKKLVVLVEHELKKEAFGEVNLVDIEKAIELIGKVEYLNNTINRLK